MADVAADVPGKFDIVIDGHGYVFANEIDANLAFRTQRAKYSYSPTFVPRSNVSGDYGDNQQDFYFTYAQNDWSLGEGVRFFRFGDEAKTRSYWKGSCVDITHEGQVTLSGKIKSLTFAANAYAATSGYAYPYVATTTNLYQISGTGTITDLGAHGAGAFTEMLSDWEDNLIMLGTVVRRYDTIGSTFSTFNASSYTHGAVVGNTLFAAKFGTLDYIDTGGTAHNIYTWKTVNGSTGPQFGLGDWVVPYGGSVLVGKAVGPGYELYTATTAGVTQVARMPNNFFLTRLLVSRGIAFIAGIAFKRNEGSRTEIYYYNNGVLNLLWHGEYQSTGILGRVGITEWLNGLVWNDSSGSHIYYDLTTGASSTIAPYTPSSVTNTPTYAGTDASLLFIDSGDTAGYFFYDTTSADSGYVISSLIDFESSLDKYVKAVKVDWEAASDGDGGSVDIAYQLNSLDGSYTNVQTGAVAGTEYTIGQPCRSISIKVTLNRGTSTRGPKLKRVYVRAVPTQQTFRSDEVILDCTGRDGKTPVVLRNGNPHPLDGQQMATNLKTSITATSPISITDRFGTITGVIDAANSEIIEVRPEEYMARIAFRQV